MAAPLLHLVFSQALLIPSDLRITLLLFFIRLFLFLCLHLVSLLVSQFLNFFIFLSLGLLFGSFLSSFLGVLLLLIPLLHSRFQALLGVSQLLLALFQIAHFFVNFV